MNKPEPMKYGGVSLTRQINAPLEKIYTARFHLIEPNIRLIYSFDMHVGGLLFSVSLAGVEFRSKSVSTELTYTEQGLFLIGEYNVDSRTAGTNGLLDKFSAYIESMK